jgi:hypothetical protein
MAILIVIFPFWLGAQQVRLNEIMSSNQFTIQDDDGAYSDWIEIYNPTSDTIDLEGYGLTDDPSRPFKWVFPAVRINPEGYLLVWASGKDRRPTSTDVRNLVAMDVYDNIQGSRLQQLYNSPKFPNNPDRTIMLSSGFSTPENLADNYGARVRGYFEAPLSGDYVFWLSGDDESELYISLTGDEADAFRIAWVPDWSWPWEWDKFSSQRSTPIRLEAGETYFLQGLMKEGGGGDHLRVRWTLPTGQIQDPVPASVFKWESFGLHTNFSLSAAGETVILTSPDGILVDSVPAVALRSDVSFGRSPDGEGEWFYFESPTPGEANNVGSTSILDPVIFDKVGQFYENRIEIMLEHPDPDVTIRYTLDGSTPSRIHGTLYASPIVLVNTRLVRAIAFKEGAVASVVSAEVYSRMGGSISTFSSNLPVVVLHQFDQPIQPENGSVSYFTLYDTQANGRTTLTDTYNLQGRVNINIRGSSSQQFPKKSYAFHLWNEDGSNRKESLLGMPEEHNWILYAPYTDKTMIRDILAFDYGRDLGHYAPRAKLVELYLHEGFGPLSQAHYHGVYVLIERIKIAPGRVEIESMEPFHNTEPEISGGYIFKNDRLNPGEVGFQTTRGSHFAHVRPQEDQITNAQRDWLTQYLNQFEAILFGPNFKDPVNGYAKFIDVNSFIDYHLLTEVFKEIDGYRLSTFLHKDRDGKLKMGPLWDFNLSLGNANYLEGWRPEGWYFPLISSRDYLYGWYSRLFQDEAFRTAYNRRYRLLRADKLATATFHAKIDSYAELLSESQVRNYQRWPILGTYVWPNWFIGQSYADEINWMKNWIRNRLLWIDGQLGEAIEQRLIHYWNFNNTTNILEPSFTYGGGQIDFELTDFSEVISGTGQGFSGLNARNGDPVGAHLRINFPIDVVSTFSLPTTDHENVVLKYETRRSGSGANRQFLSYSIDGELFLPLDTITVTETPTLLQYDFSNNSQADNNPHFKIRVIGGHDPSGPGGEVGNHRVDNFTMEGEIMAGVNSPPIATFEQLNKGLIIHSDSWILNLNEYFTDPDGDSLTYTFELEKEAHTQVGLQEHMLIVSPLIVGNNGLKVFASDGKSPPVDIQIDLLQFPAGHTLGTSYFSFTEWSPDQPEGTFPDNMIFLQSRQNDPTLDSELWTAYHVPPSDLAPADSDKVGFPYGLTARTRLNGLGDRGISFINTGRERDLGAAVLSLSTEGLSSGWIHFTAGTETPNFRVYHLRLQYAIDPDGPWLDWPMEPVEYQRQPNSGHESEFRNIPLPSDALNQPNLLVRWKYYFTGTQLPGSGGARDMLRLDDIQVTTKRITTIPQLIYPAPQAEEVERNPTFSWTSIPSIENYQIQLRTLDEAPDWTQTWDVGVSSSWINPELLNPDTWHEWRVRVNDAESISEWSDLGSFQTGIMVSTSFSPQETEPLIVYPNPLFGYVLYFNKAVTGKIYHITGREIQSISNANSVELRDVNPGVYILRTAEGEQKTVIMMQ